MDKVLIVPLNITGVFKNYEEVKNV